MNSFLAWIPAVAWMAAIFFLSGRQRIEASDSNTINFLIFKTLHVIEYFTLYILVFRAFHKTLPMRAQKRAYIFAFIAAVLYATSDEFHQTFVPTREGTVRDVIIDAAGAMLAWIALKKLLPRVPTKLRLWAKSLHIS